MECEPIARAEVLTVAVLETPEPGFRAKVPRFVLVVVSRKVTVPLGGSAPPTGEVTTEVTVAVKVTVAPNMDGACDELTDAVVPARLTVAWTGPAVPRVDVTTANEMTPLYGT